MGTINGLLAACQGQEAKFIIRSCEGKLRIGLAEQTVLGSLASAIVYARHAKDGGKKLSSEKIAKELEDASRIIKTVFSECPNYDKVVPPLLEGGPEMLREKIRITPGIPLKPMLAKPTKAISEVLDRFEGKKFTCEYKYDGERAQVHYHDGKLSVFSRNSEDMSVKYPDLIEHMQSVCYRSFQTPLFLNHTYLNTIPVYQTKYSFVCTGCGGCCIRQGGRKDSAVPGTKQTQEERCQGGRYQSESPHLCIRPALSEWRGELAHLSTAKSKIYLTN